MKVKELNKEEIIKQYEISGDIMLRATLEAY